MVVLLPDRQLGADRWRFADGYRLGFHGRRGCILCQRFFDRLLQLVSPRPHEHPGHERSRHQ